MKNTQKIILEFIENDYNNDDLFKDLINNLDDQKFRLNKHNLKELLHLISKITKHHNRNLHFFDKIKKIIKEYKTEILGFYSNWEIFNIFKSNKIIILFLFEEKIIKPTNDIFYIIINDKNKNKYYPHYLYPEFKHLFNDKLKRMVENEIIQLSNDENIITNLELFNEKRKIGENDSYICQIIRKDSIDDFINYVNKINMPLTSTINNSIFETNGFLLKKDTSLIDYSAFFGSIRIFKYLYKNHVIIEQSTLLYAIHSQNLKMIHLIIGKLHQNNYKPNDIAFFESIKCHYNELAIYFNNNNDLNIFEFQNCLRKYNFLYSNFMFNYNDLLAFFSQIDCYNIVNVLTKSNKIDINELQISKLFSFLI